MRRRRPANLVVVGIYALFTAGLLWIPLLNVLHAEASASIAVLAFFVSGFDAVTLFERAGYRVREVIPRQWAYLLVPFLIFQAARLWLPGCDFLEGVKFYVLFPVVSVVLAVAVAFLLTRLVQRRVRVWFALLGLAIATIPVVYDLGFHPQFYVYNHVFGGILGPIYDLELTTRPGLYRFRVLTLLWAGLAILVGHRVREPVRGGILGTAVLVGAILMFYLFPGRLGINTTYDQLARELGAELRTTHFVIHYDSSAISPLEIGYLAADHEFRYSQLAARLEFESALPVHSYLYPSPAKRAALTGAGQTDIAPVWLGRPQVHVLLDSYAQSFAHELAHVFSREMGVPVLRASFRVGLVEGFAVAMEPPIGLPSPDDQVSAVIGSPKQLAVYHDASMAEAVAAALSPAGFWTGRGAVSYTTMGSFVGFLIDEYGVEAFSRVYGMEDFSTVYGQSVGSLAAGWERRLRERKPDAFVLDLASRRFSIPSLFERYCPHDVSEPYLAFRNGQSRLAAGDSAAAMALFATAFEDAPDFADALDAWAGLKLAKGDYYPVALRIGSVWSAQQMQTTRLSVRLGDSFALSDRPEQAERAYRVGLDAASPYARSWRGIVHLRVLVRDRADILQIVVGAQEPGSKAAALAQVVDSTGAASILAALDFAEAEEYSAAADALARAEGTTAARLIGERYPAWRAGFSFRAGRLADAERFRRTAVEAAHAGGDHFQIARLEDFRERIRWTVAAGGV
ncbi:MAG: hypothetical protein ACC655_02540 [Rhodothermia bacterium]